MNICLAYFRVSTSEQADSGKSIETQQKLCHKWSEENGYQIVQEYIDAGQSATSLNRPGLKELLARCQEDKTIKAVIVQDTDRWCRSTIDHLTTKSILQKAGVQLISISQPMLDSSPEGILADTIIASVNAFQSQLTGRKTSKVLEQKALMGWWPGGRPVLGYKNIDNPNPTSTLDKKIVSFDTEKAQLMKRAFEIYATSQISAQNLADSLYKQGLRPQNGGRLYDSVLINYLQNPFYIGKFRWHGEIYKAKHPPLISEELFEQCQDVLAAHNQNASRTRKHNFLLRGHVFCDICGRRFWGEQHVKKSGWIVKDYFCASCRRGTYVNKDLLEKLVEKQFEKIEISSEYAQKVIEAAKQLLQEFRESKNNDRVILYSRKAKLEAAMREAEDNRFIHHAISDEAFKRIYPRYEEELKAIDNQIHQLEDNHSEKISAIQKLYNLAENIGQTYKEADINLKRHYLGLFWKAFFIRDGKIVTSELNDNVKPLLSKNLVRVSKTLLPALAEVRTCFITA